jgi:uncharacterized protein involved in exopolysaccharide biosynthesis
VHNTLICSKRTKANHDVLSPQEALDHLRNALKIEAVRGTYIVKVTVSSEVPQEAADIANAVVDHYKAQRDRDEAERNKRGEDVLREQIAQQQKVVDDAKAEVEKQRQNLNLKGPTLPDNNKDPLVPFRDAQRQLEQQQSLLDALNVRLKQCIADKALQESPVRIISRAVAPPE